MIRTKHALVFFIALGVLFAGLAVYLLLYKGALTDGEVVNTEPTFVEESRDYAVVPEETEDKEAAREALRAKLGTQNEVSEPAFEPEAEDTEGPTEDTRVPTSTPEVSTSTPPLFSATLGDVTLAGVHGSYCWKGICQMELVTDLPYSAPVVSASGTISFQPDTQEQPNEIFVFFNSVAGTSTIESRALTPTEVANRSFTVPDATGTYLLFITGVWPGNQDVSSVFKIEIR